MSFARPWHLATARAAVAAAPPATVAAAAKKPALFAARCRFWHGAAGLCGPSAAADGDVAVAGSFAAADAAAGWMEPASSKCAAVDAAAVDVAAAAVLPAAPPAAGDEPGEARPHGKAAAAATAGAGDPCILDLRWLCRFLKLRVGVLRWGVDG